MNMSDPAPTLDDVWRLFRETDRQLKETDRQLKETDLQLKETDRQLKEQAREAERRSQETDRQLKETDRQLKETDRQLKEQSQEAERRLRETDRQLKEQFQEAERRSQETDRRFRETERFIKELSKETDKKIGRLTNRLGEFVEEFIKPGVVRLFQTRGIPVHKVHSDISANNPHLNLATQIDLLVVNGEVCALIEVKSKLSIDDVNEHIERMEKFKPLFPEYADKKAFGAVASMVIAENVAQYAYRKGFFVVAQQGESVAFLNDDNFKPTAW